MRFGPFELNLETGELLKQGTRIKLQDQPFQILRILLEKPGHVVSREELKNRVWPADTFVEFDQGVYSAIRRLRDSLCDSAESPRYIETLARRGYRFIESLKETPPADSPEKMPLPFQLEEDSATSSRISSPDRGSDAKPFVRFPLGKPALWITAGLLIFAGIVVSHVMGRKDRVADTKTVTFQRLTDFVGLEEFPAISPDGKTVAFTADTGPNRQIWSA